MFNFIRNCQTFYQSGYFIYALASNVWKFCFFRDMAPYPDQHLVSSAVFKCSHPNVYGMIFHCDFSIHLFDNWWWWDFAVRLLEICITSFVKGLFNLFSFSNFFGLLVSCRYPYTLWMFAFGRYIFANIFKQYLACLFFLQMMSFDEQKFLLLKISKLYIFMVVTFYMLSIKKKFNPRLWIYSPVFSSRSVSFLNLGLIFKLNQNWIKFCV